MKRDLILIMLAATSLSAGALGGWQFHVAEESGRIGAALGREQVELRSRIAGLESQAQATATKATAVEVANAALTKEVEQLRSAPAPTATATSAAAIEQRIGALRQLAESGDPAHALREILWCLNSGLEQLSRTRRSSRVRMIVQAFARLAERDPAAQAALRERWTNARAKLLQVGDIDGVVEEYSVLSDALKERGAMLALYDQIPPGHSVRRHVGIRAFDDMVKTQRYRDAADTRQAVDMSATFTLMIDNSRPGLREHALKTAATNVEVLAGSGQLEAARELMARMLRADGTPATHALLRTHLTRAGRPEMAP